MIVEELIQYCKTRLEATEYYNNNSSEYWFIAGQRNAYWEIIKLARGEK